MLKLIKLALLSIVLLFIVVTAISLLIPSHIRISKAINLSANRDSVFALIADTSNWKQWHPAFLPTDSTPKFPAVHITRKIESDSEIVMYLQQAGKPQVINGWKIYQNNPADSLTLQWYMDFHLQWYPWEKFSSLLYENTYGKMMEEGLEHLRQHAER